MRIRPASGALAIDGGGGYSSIFGTLIFLAALTTVLAATAGVNAWRFGRGWLIAATVVASVLASALILFIGAAIELRG